MASRFLKGLAEIVLAASLSFMPGCINDSFIRYKSEDPAVIARIDTMRKDVRQMFYRAQHINYVRDAEYTDYWQSPAETLKRKAGDCEDKALLLLDDLVKNGYKAEFVAGSIHDSGAVYAKKVNGQKKRFQEGHAWVEAELNGDIYILDPTNDKKSRRDNMPKWMYTHIEDSFSIMKRIMEYREKNNINYTINSSYEQRIKEYEEVKKKFNPLNSLRNGKKSQTLIDQSIG